MTTLSAPPEVWEEIGVSSTPSIPNDRAAEEATLGAVLIDPEKYIDLVQFLHADDFYIHRNRWIWEAFERLHEKRIPLDILTVTQEIDQVGQLAEIGSPAYLTSLLNQTPTSLHAVTYAHAVEACAIRRRMLNAANQIATLALDNERPIDEVVGESMGAVQRVAWGIERADTLTMTQLVSQHYDLVDERAQKPEETFGVNTGFVDFDKITGGIRPKYYMFAGRPGSNKTSLMLNLTLRFAEKRKRTLYVSREQGQQELTNLLLSILAEVDNQRLETGKMEGEEWARYIHAVETLNGYGENIILDDHSRRLATISARCQAIKADILVIDNLGNLLDHADAKREPDRINGISRDIHLMQHDDLHIPVLVVHHMNRMYETSAGRTPILADLREGGEADADVVAFIYAPQVNGIATPIRNIYFAKHRGGGLGVLSLFFKDYCTKFENAATHKIDFGNHKDDDEEE